MSVISLDEYKKQIKENIKIMSRTANGIVDVSASVTKKDFMLVESGKEAKDRTLKNIDNAITFIYENKDRLFIDESELKDFILEIASIVTRGIVRDGYLLRQGSDSAKYQYTKIKDLEYSFDIFISELFSMISKNDISEERAITISGFCEYMINITGHYFSDGCSKTSILVSAYILMRNNLKLPVYRNREEYYSIAKKRPVPTRENIYDKEFLREFLIYYMSHF